MFPDPKKMFGPSDEDNKRAYADGVKDAHNTKATGHVLHEIGDFFGKFVPDNRNSADKSYEAGWHDASKRNYKHKNKKDRESKTTSTYHGGSSDSPIMTIFAALFIGITVIGGVYSIFNPEAANRFFKVGSERNISESQETVWRMGRVNTQKLNVRSNPGTNSPLVAQFDKGARLAFTGELVRVGNTSWIRVSTDDGKIRGWANRQYLDPKLSDK